MVYASYWGFLIMDANQTNIFTPDGMPEMEVAYTIFPGDTIYPDDIEINGIAINGNGISHKLETHLIESLNIIDDIMEGL